MTIKESVTALRVRGVGRDCGHPYFISVSFNREPTDDELRAVHEGLRAIFTSFHVGKEGK